MIGIESTQIVSFGNWFYYKLLLLLFINLFVLHAIQADLE